MANDFISVLGFHNWLKSENKDLFEQLNLPPGIDKETLVDNILIKAAEFEVIYSNPYFMQDAIGNWSKRYYFTFDKWIKVLTLEYNPIDNYDRHEEWTDKNTGTVSDQGTNTGTVSNTSEASSSDSSSNSNSGTTTNTKSAFDSSAYSPDNQSEASTEGSGSSESESSASNTRTDNLSNSNIRTDDLTSIHTGRIRGNIGVMSTQNLISQETELYKNFNIYEQITDLFLQEFCILIY